MLFNLGEKIKAFIHSHYFLDKSAFFIFGLFYIIRAKFSFIKVKKNTQKPFTNSNPKSKKIIILAVRTIPSTNLVYFDALFGHAFRKLGCDVKMLYCDGFVDSCDADTAFRNQKAQCFVCQKFGPLVKNSLGLDCVSYRNYILNSDIEEIEKKVAALRTEQLLNYNYLGINVGLHARASAVRFFLFGKIDLNNPQQAAVLRKKLVYAMLSAKIASNLFDKEKPDAIFMLHGIYSTWGPFLSYFLSKGAETFIYDNKLSKFGNFTFFHNCEAFKTFGQSWSDFSRLSLNKEQERQLNDYLAERFKGKVGEHLMYRGNFKASKEKNSILKSLSQNNYLRRYVLFPNVGWDGGVKGDTSEIFEDMFAWIDATLRFFKKNKDYQLVVKAHPAELIYTSEGRCKGIAEYIIEKYGPLENNISVLPPDTSVKAYDLIGPKTISITYDGTIGLETASLGFPALVVSETHYSKAGAVKKVENLDEYLRLLQDPSPLISFAKNNIELAKKYAYFYFFKSMARVPFYRDDKWSIIDWKKIRNAKELFSQDSKLIKICKKIINKEDVVEPL